MDMEYSHQFEADTLDERHFESHPDRHFELASVDRFPESFARLESHLTSRNFDTSLVSRSFEHHSEIDQKLMEERNFESSPQADMRYESIPSTNRTYEIHSDRNAAFVMGSRTFEPHIGSDRNDPMTLTSRTFETHGGSDRSELILASRTYETHGAERGYDHGQFEYPEPSRMELHSHRDRNSQPLDCSTTLTAIDHRLEGKCFLNYVLIISPSQEISQ